MKPYHKIKTLFKRDPKTHKVIVGGWTCLEFAYLAECGWSFEEKIHGTNIRVMIGDGEIRFGGRTNNAQLPAPLVENMSAHFLGERKAALLEQFQSGACFYGEGCGPGIQKGGEMYADKQEFILFDIRIGDWWLTRQDIMDIAKEYDLRVAPLRGRGSLGEAQTMVCTGLPSLFDESRQAEGLILRPLVELQTRGGERIIAKLKCGDF